MRYPASLRAALTAACADILTDNPAKLKIWVTNGKNPARFPVGGFEWRYRISVFFEAWPTDGAGRISVTILDWIAANQPALLLNHETGNEAISFEAEILDDREMDILYEFDLAESVLVERDGDIAPQLVPIDEPPIAGSDRFEGIEGDPLLQGIIFGDGAS